MMNGVGFGLVYSSSSVVNVVFLFLIHKPASKNWQKRIEIQPHSKIDLPITYGIVDMLSVSNW